MCPQTIRIRKYRINSIVKQARLVEKIFRQEASSQQPHNLFFKRVCLRILQPYYYLVVLQHTRLVFPLFINENYLLPMVVSDISQKKSKNSHQKMKNQTKICLVKVVQAEFVQLHGGSEAMKKIRRQGMLINRTIFYPKKI